MYLFSGHLEPACAKKLYSVIKAAIFLEVARGRFLSDRVLARASQRHAFPLLSIDSLAGAPCSPAKPCPRWAHFRNILDVCFAISNLILPKQFHLARRSSLDLKQAWLFGQESVLNNYDNMHMYTRRSCLRKQVSLMHVNCLQIIKT